MPQCTFHSFLLPEIMTEFINIVSRVEFKDICGIDFQVLFPSSVKDSHIKSFISFPKVSF